MDNAQLRRRMGTKENTEAVAQSAVYKSSCYSKAQSVKIEIKNPSDRHSRCMVAVEHIRKKEASARL